MIIQYEKDGSPRLGTEGDLDEFLVGLVYTAANFNALRAAVVNGHFDKKAQVEKDLESTYAVAKSSFKRILAEHSQYEGDTQK